MVNPLIEREIQCLELSGPTEKQLLALLAIVEIKERKEEQHGR